MMNNPFANMPKPARWATAIGGTLAVGYVFYRRHQTTGTWNPFSSGTAMASASATPDSSSASATGSSADNGSSALGSDSGGGSGDLAQVPVYGSSADLSSSSPYTLNTTYPSAAQWAQAAQAGLTSIGYDPETVAAALGAYIAQQPLTAAQESIVQVAVAEYGQPDGANGMPLQILSQPAVTPVTSTTGTAPSVGSSTTAPAAKAPATPGGVHATKTGTTSVELAWSASSGATQYRTRFTYQGAVVADVTSSAPSVSISGLTPDHTYTAHVAAGNSAGWSPETNGPAVKTSKG